eukprot:s4303_g4.t1
MDSLVCDYLEHLWSSGAGRALACDTLAGLQDYQPNLRNHLPGAWRLLRAWHVNELPNRAPPLPEQVVQAMAGWAFFKGYVSFGISLVVAFYSMLRTGELLGLRFVGPFMLRVGEASNDLTKLAGWVDGKLLRTEIAEVFSFGDASKALLALEDQGGHNTKKSKSKAFRGKIVVKVRIAGDLRTGVMLNQALLNFGLAFLRQRGYRAMQPPYFMRRNLMSDLAQLSDFDEQLYKVNKGETDEAEKYLIATSEQPLCALHSKEILEEETLPRRYAGISTCFRTELGKAGKENKGIFRVHQFEKVEQFCITTGDHEKSQEIALAKQLVGQKLGPSFGQGGDFTVLVEEAVPAVPGDVNSNGAAGDGTVEGGENSGSAAQKRTEFKVWSVILSSWSEVFDRMISQDYVESSKKEVIIKDFSSNAVAIFLKFLYSGTLDPPPEMLIEVSMIADKYQVLELQNLCLDMLKDALTPETAWAIFQSADHFQWKELRQKCKEMILVEAKVALAERPNVKSELLEEVLGSNLLCITDAELFSLLWTKWQDAGAEPVSNRSLINKFVSIGNVPDHMRDSFFAPVQDLEVEDMPKRRKRGEHTRDLFSSVKSRFDDWVHQHKIYLANWVSVSLSSRDANAYKNLYELASGGCPFGGATLRVDCWIEYRLTQFALHLLAVRFKETLREDLHIEIFCAGDFSDWHLVHMEMLRIAQDFYEVLGISYRVVKVVSGELNDAAVMKFDLEGWFPSQGDSGEYKELVSCSNCTDFQSRALDIRSRKLKEKPRFVHMLNSTLVASGRCMCCILETYQTATGVKVPTALVPFMGLDFMPFVREVRSASQKNSKATAKA